ncbi:polymer-forming cytoskeletal protein [Escherichia coli]|nr:polymer-forming cytoskeletal protein [Escherichia coli]EFN6818235.1 polymer-forming cytoskeletal protein [Escherichia coli O83:H15]EFC0637933.1 polymer-forming cytoskeletal protein [Escherichia coli]EFC1448289.1 polymer-forming cytoskeletal protein [Escherichia coli]EFC1600546.1 polymer-forming cytoskeletal protein [Escherichia coli]
MCIEGKKQLQKEDYNRLWLIWIIWALLLFLCTISDELWTIQALLFLVFMVLVCIFLYGMRHTVCNMFRINKKQTFAETKNKVTFISSKTSFSGTLNSDSDVTIEGCFDGDIVCESSVNINYGCCFVGEIRAKIIVINGSVEGKCIADCITIQSQGKFYGDILSNALSIERGGQFIGQSQQSDTILLDKSNFSETKLLEIRKGG